MASLGDCRDEIERLHQQFVRCYTGQQADIGPIDAALVDDFGMVAPDGAVVDRESVLAMVREKADSYAPGEFDIEIRNVERIDEGVDLTVCRYEEWQRTPGGRDWRVSTVVFRTAEDAPTGLSWVSVHETPY